MIIREGVGIGRIQIGVSTFNDVVNVYGSNYIAINHKQFSNEIKLINIGISFYYYCSDEEKKIFCISIKEPFEWSTSKGIVLGKSLMIDVIKNYGEPTWRTTDESETWWSTYEGINFHVPIDKSIPRFPLDEKRYIKKTIIEIDIIESDKIDSGS